MALVSSLYKLAPSNGHISNEEANRRLKLILKRLVTQYGEEAVRHRVREAKVTKDQEATKAWIILHLMS